MQGSYSLRYFWVLMGFLVVAPLSCFQSLNALKYTSSLSMIFIMFLAVIVVLFAFPTYSRLDPCLGYPGSSGSADAGICTGAKELYHIDTNSLRALSVFVFGYTCQQVLFLTAKSLLYHHVLPALLNSSSFSVFLIPSFLHCFLFFL